MDRDRYFTAEEARDYGLVDRVITAHELGRSPAGFAGRRNGDADGGSSESVGS
jgi:ATP-dependent Clp protease, protease subunit